MTEDMRFKTLLSAEDIAAYLSDRPEEFLAFFRARLAEEARDPFAITADDRLRAVRAAAGDVPSWVRQGAVRPLTWLQRGARP